MEVEYCPYKKLLVLDHVQHKSPEGIALRIAAGGNVQPLMWCEGIVFSASGHCLHAQTEEIVKLLLSGVKPVEHVHWSLMPQPASVVKSNGIECPVVVSEDEDDVSLARWLKTQIKEKQIA